LTAGANRQLELNVAGGARICVPFSLDQITPYVLLEQEDWFEDEIRFVRRWLRRGMQAVDIGANIGVYTVAMAQAVGSSGRVWAFEPTPAAADSLQRSLSLNGFENVIVFRAAVSDCEGTVAFSVGNQSELNAVAKPGSAGRDIAQVRAVTLDRMAAEHGWTDMDLVKLDVEGHEFEAIRGGAGFLGESSPLIMFEIKADETFDLRILGPLADLGYEFYRLLPGPLWLVPFDPHQPVDIYQLNLFACKPDRAESVAALGMLVRADAADTGTPSAEAWKSYLRRMPYARGLAARWPSKAGFFSGGGLATYLEGLAAYAHSREENRNASERHGWLTRSFYCVVEALDVAPTLARRISYARLARDLGMRYEAIGAFAEAADRLSAESQAALAEPFLAPSERYEFLHPERDGREWLKCGVVEQFEKLRLYSSAFAGATSLEVLAPIRGLPQCSAEMERRWQLARMRNGMQAGPEPAAVLRERSDENLNPQFWSGAGLSRQ
jgi:FkbM family methyltransferase